MAATVRRAALLALLCPVAAGAAEPPAACGSHAGACDAGEQVALMQLNVKVKGGGLQSQDPDDVPTPFGRTILSTDPHATAQWVLATHPKAELVTELGDCGQAERAVIRLNMASQVQILVFVKVDPASLPAGAADPSVEIPRVEKIVGELFAQGGNWTSWLDNHDGLGCDFDAQAAMDLGGHVGLFTHVCSNGDTPTESDYLFPHTMYAVQAGIPDGATVPEFLLTDCRADDGTARAGIDLLETRERQQSRGMTGWRKSTFMVADPVKAVNFAATVLGATPADESPYPWPPVQGCSSALWGSFSSGFELHFVNAPEYQTTPTMIQDYTDRVLGGRDLEAGVFDAWMYNNVILTVASLDPYIMRLKDQGLPFLLYSVGDEGQGKYALFVTVPGNDITFQLRSAHVTAAAPSAEQLCVNNLSGLF